jgi:DNA-binding transcriptional LysR family regulator
MDRDLLGHLPIIVCVARHRSFAAAAAELGMSPSAVSHAVRSVEDRLGTPLFARTTRSVSLTEAGARLIGGVESALTDIGRTFEGLTAERGEVTGLLRINALRVARRSRSLIYINTTALDYASASLVQFSSGN